MTYLDWGCDPLEEECESCLDAVCNACNEEVKKSPGIMRFLSVPGGCIWTLMNRIVIIAIREKSPIVPVVKLSWRSAKTAAEIKRANSGSSDPADQPDLSGI
jgi:hypothetical protein